MSNTNYAIFVDLENAGGKVHTLNTIIEKVKIRGNILQGRAYGYTDAFSPLKELLLSNTFTVVPSIKFGHSQKNNLDIQLVIDALEVAYKNELIDCFCIVSGDSDYTPLVGKLKSMGKFVLGISRSEAASKIFINACNEFIFLESMSAPPKDNKQQKKNERENGDLTDLNDLVTSILTDRDDGYMYASELKSTVLRLRPDFNERSYGADGFARLLGMMAAEFKTIRTEANGFSLKVRAATDRQKDEVLVTKDNWSVLARVQLDALKDEGFSRVNPSVVKQAMLEAYPGFDEKALGFKKFSDLIKALKQLGIVAIETDDQRSLLVRII